MPIGLPRHLTVRKAVIVAVMLGVLLPALSAGIYFTRVIYKDSLGDLVAQTIKRDSEVVALGIRESLWALDTETATALIDAVMRDPALVRVEVLDAKLGSFVTRELAERRVGNLHHTELTIVHRGFNIGVARLEFTEEPVAEQLRGQLMPLLGVLTLQVIASVLLILIVLQKRLGEPLHRLSGEAARLARGELDVPIEPWRRDEIGEVELQLETTRQSLQGLVRTLEQKNRALEVDLRERMRVEAALRDREQRIRMLVQQSPIAVIEYDLGWHILDWNEAASRIFGWPREEMLGRHAAFLTPPGETEHAHAPEGLLEGEPGNLGRKSRNLRSDGSSIVCQWYHSVIRDGNGVGQRIVSMAEDITERQRIEDEIRRLATVVRLTTNLVALTDGQGRIEWHNEALSRRAGMGRGALLGAPLMSVLRGGLAPDADADELARALAEGRPVGEAELPCQTASGERYWVSAEIQPIRDETGQHVQSVVLLNDITDKHRIAETLRNVARIGATDEPRIFLEQLLGSVARGARAHAAYLALHGEAQHSSDVVASWALGPEWRIKVGETEPRPAVLPVLMEKGRLIARDGFSGPLADDPVLQQCPQARSFVAIAITNAAQEAVGHIALLFASAMADSEESESLAELAAARAGAEFARVQALDALRHSEQKFSSIFQHSPIPLALLRRSDGIYLDVNPAQLEAFGYRREDFLGRNSLEIGLYERPEDRRELLERLHRDGYVGGFPVALRTRDGDVRDCQIYLRTVFMNEPCLLVATVDISALRHAQRQVEELNQSLEHRVVERTQALADANAELATAVDRLSRTQDELVRSEKLAALGSLVAGVAHELNTPIGNSLMVASTLRDLTRELRRQVEQGLRRSELEYYMGEADSAADILVRNLHRAGELIVSFKQVAVDQTSSQRRVFDLQEVVHEIIVTMQPTFRKTPYRVESTIAHDIWMDSYPGPFGQVIANLLNNTVVHAFDGRDAGHVELSARLLGNGEVEVRCADDGVGIPPANLSRIFDPFFTTKLGQEGTGLGLNIVHNIVTGVLGGHISVESEPGKGTTFILRLPLAAPRSA